MFNLVNIYKYVDIANVLTLMKMSGRHGQPPCRKGGRGWQRSVTQYSTDDFEGD